MQTKDTLAFLVRGTFSFFTSKTISLFLFQSYKLILRAVGLMFLLFTLVLPSEITILYMLATECAVVSVVLLTSAVS